MLQPIYARYKRFLENNPAMLAALIAGVVFLVGATAVIFTQEENDRSLSANINDAAAEASTTTSQVSKDPFEDISIQAKAAIVWDARENTPLYSHNEITQLPLASLSKIMTVLIADEYLDEDSTITITPESLRAYGDEGLQKYDRWSYTDLRDFTLISSSNDGARALASAVMQRTSGSDSITAIMSKKARDIGLDQTFFLNPSGLDIDENAVSGGYGSARDITLLVDYIIKNKPHILEATTQSKSEFQSQNGYIHTAKNTNDIINNIPFLIASKTGFTDLAGGNLTIAFDTDIGHPYIITVLGSTREGRFDDVMKLYDATMQHTNPQSK